VKGEKQKPYFANLVPKLNLGTILAILFALAPGSKKLQVLVTRTTA
jgi:hypothetical protein